MAAVVTDNRDRDRFEIHLGDELVGIAQYRLRDDTIAFTHAEVSDEHEGQGLGSTLAGESLAAARKAGLAVLPACPFFADYLQRHPEHVDLVPAERREEFGL
ncbi:GNAT family N-acetyltransferase [Nocardioides coralli]|uniref:GNAT family N-acetyltransferase n=1 Tax=Nocardioides coralli TaxID=2872154 RepID=UPI001CA41FE7|nr:GNAT family N-acetyltransferase [Nocardioides coralli]QZY29205.1 N-acetyltransferase [Nocardioides coralli]